MKTQFKIIVIALFYFLFSACAKEEIISNETFVAQAGKKNIIENVIIDEECDFSPLAYSVQKIGNVIELNSMCPDKYLNWSVQSTIGFGDLVPDVVNGYGGSISFNDYANAEHEVTQSGWVTSAGGLTYYTTATSCFSFTLGGDVELCDDSSVINGVSLANIPEGGGGAGAITPVITP